MSFSCFNTLLLTKRMNLFSMARKTGRTNFVPSTLTFLLLYRTSHYPPLVPIVLLIKILTTWSDVAVIAIIPELKRKRLGFLVRIKSQQVLLLTLLEVNFIHNSSFILSRHGGEYSTSFWCWTFIFYLLSCTLLTPYTGKSPIRDSVYLFSTMCQVSDHLSLVCKQLYFNI